LDRPLAVKRSLGRAVYLIKTISRSAIWESRPLIAETTKDEWRQKVSVNEAYVHAYGLQSVLAGALFGSLCTNLQNPCGSRFFNVGAVF